MTAQLTAKNLEAGHGPRILFSGLDLVVAPGDVIGLVGANGAGKSTLLRILAGIDSSSSGTVTLSPPDANIGLLPQEIDRVPGETVRAHLLRRTGVTSAEAALERATSALADGLAGAADDYSSALDRWLSLGGADVTERCAEVAADIGLTVDLDLDMSALSGGEAARVGLAGLLLSRFDLLLLDEPTNDLDLAGLDRLERYLDDTAAGIVVISHDRELLSRCATRILEIDIHQQEVTAYGGGFDAYLVERERRREHARERYEDYAVTLGSLKERGRTQRAWADKGVRAARRSPADNDKSIKHHNVATSEKQAAKARQTDRMIERLEVVSEPRKEWQLDLSIASAPPSGRVVAVLSAAVVRRGPFSLGPVTLQIDRGDRVAVTGANGSGKSTLLALMLGRVAPVEGTATLGSSVHIGEIDQARAAFFGSAALLEAFGSEVPAWPTSEVRTLLAKFGLGGEHVLRPAASLSPGERTRAALALLQARGVNLLVLDEPTNHLDLPAIEQLESALDSFGGTILLVTHDRRLLDTVRITRRLEVRDGQVAEV